MPESEEVAAIGLPLLSPEPPPEVPGKGAEFPPEEPDDEPEELSPGVVAAIGDEDPDDEPPLDVPGEALADLPLIMFPDPPELAKALALALAKAFADPPPPITEGGGAGTGFTGVCVGKEDDTDTADVEEGITVVEEGITVLEAGWTVVEDGAAELEELEVLDEVDVETTVEDCGVGLGAI